MPGTETKHKVRDVNVRMLRGGSGPPLLFLHGANGLPVWLPVFDLLVQAVRGVRARASGLRHVGQSALDAQHRRSRDVLPRFPRRARAASRSIWSASRSAAGPRPRSRCATARGSRRCRCSRPPASASRACRRGDNFIWGAEEGGPQSLPRPGDPRSDPGDAADRRAGRHHADQPLRRREVRLGAALVQSVAGALAAPHHACRR